jgi:hypothetical protein
MSSNPTKQQRTPTVVEKRLVDARAEIVARVWGDYDAVFNHAVLCAVGLPYRRLPDDQRVFARSSGGSLYGLKLVPFSSWRPRRLSGDWIALRTSGETSSPPPL